MKKILLGLFILGTLGMAQSNYEVYVKSGVKISQSEVDRDSKEIENLINKEIIERYNREGKKIIVEKATELYKKTINNSINEIMEEVPKKQKQAFKAFTQKISEIMGPNMLNELNNNEISISKVLFPEKDNVKVELLFKSKNLDFDIDEIIDEVVKKSNISDDEFKHLEKISKTKLDKFYKYLEDEIKEAMKNSDYDEETSEIKIKKVNGKWQLEDFKFEDFFYNIENIDDIDD